MSLTFDATLRAEMSRRRKLFDAELRAEMRRRECIEKQLRAIRAAVRRLPPEQRPTPACLPLTATAKRLGIGYARLKSLVKTHSLLTVMVGGRVVVPISEVARAESMLAIAKTSRIFPRAAPPGLTVMGRTA